MPHCEHCNHFYPAALPAGCPMCDRQGYHKTPWCQFCGTPQTKMKEADADGRPLRPMCPHCGRGPLIPSSTELKRRLTLDPKIEPVVVDPQPVKDAAGAPVVINGDILAEVSIRRTHGPVEFYIKSYLIEQFVSTMAAYYGPNGGQPRALSLSPANPFHGHSYYSLNTVGMQFYDPTGRVPYVIGGYGTATSLPGHGRLTGNSIDLSFLLTAGLRNGVTFRYSVVIDDRSIAVCLKTVNDGLAAFYVQLMRPTEHSSIIAVRTLARGELQAQQPQPTVAKKAAHIPNALLTATLADGAAAFGNGVATIGAGLTMPQGETLTDHLRGRR